MKKIRVGIIGLGIGEQHIAGYQKHPQCEVAVLCDIDEKKRKVAREKYPAMRVVNNADEVLADPSIEVVSIASYDDVHYEQIVKAIRNNKHVFSEKPLCDKEEDARHIRFLLREKPRVRLSSNLILRKSPRFQWVRENINAGLFGDLFYAEADYNYGRLHKITEGWRGDLDFFSVVYGGGVHMVDLLLWLTGDDVLEVSAYGNGIASQGSGFRFHDLVTSILRFRNGMIGKMTVNTGCVHPHFHSVAIYGRNATFMNGLTDGLLFRSRDAHEQPEKISAPYPGMQKGDLIPSFIEAILGKSEPEVTEDDVFRAMSVCFAIEKAHTNGGCIKVDYI